MCQQEMSLAAGPPVSLLMKNAHLVPHILAMKKKKIQYWFVLLKLFSYFRRLSTIASSRLARKLEPSLQASDWPRKEPA